MEPCNRSGMTRATIRPPSRPMLLNLTRPPAPDPFLKAAERLGVEAGLCLALEDSHNGVRSASSARMMTIMVADLLEPTEEMRKLCTFVARDLHEVRRLILLR